jgi:hypothetical protein
MIPVQPPIRDAARTPTQPSLGFQFNFAQYSPNPSLFGISFTLHFPFIALSIPQIVGRASRLCAAFAGYGFSRLTSDDKGATNL